MKKIIMSLIMVTGLVFGMDYKNVFIQQNEVQLAKVEQLKGLTFKEEAELLLKQDKAIDKYGSKFGNKFNKDKFKKDIRELAIQLDDLYKKNKGIIFIYTQGMNIKINNLKLRDMLFCKLSKDCINMTDKTEYKLHKVSEKIEEVILKDNLNYDKSDTFALFRFKVRLEAYLYLVEEYIYG